MRHTGELKCQKCGKQFARKLGLKQHLRAHDGIRAYKCQNCKADFLDNRQLKDHNLKVHGLKIKGGISKEFHCRLETAPFRKLPIVTDLDFESDKI